MKRWLLALNTAMLVAALSVCPGAFAQNPNTDDTVEKLYAEARAAKSRGDLPGAIQKYQELLKVSPHLATAYNNMGLLYFQQGNYRDAAEAFENGLHYDKNMSSSLVVLGACYYQMAQFQRARAVLEKAVRLKPDDRNAELYLGLTLSDMGDLEGGATVLQGLLHKSPKNLVVLYGLGQIYMKLAQETLKKVETVAPDSYFVHLINAQTMEGMGNYDGALPEYKKAVEIEPNFRDAHYYLGNIYWLKGRWELATAEFKKEIAVDPYDCMAEWKLANILIKTHDNSGQALSYIRSSLSICPDLPQALTDYGQLLAQQGEYEKAIQQFQRALQISPGEDTVHFQLARTYQKLGRDEEAKAEFAIAQEIQQQRSGAAQSRVEDVQKAQ